MLLRTRITVASLVNSGLLSRVHGVCSKASGIIKSEKQITNKEATTESKKVSYEVTYDSGIHLSPFLSPITPQLDARAIQVVDDDSWQVSSALQRIDRQFEAGPLIEVADEEADDCVNRHDFDEIDNMRIRGNLFYKLDRNSKEFEEHSFDFHRRKKGKPVKEKNNKESKKQTLSCTSAPEAAGKHSEVGQQKTAASLLDVEHNPHVHQKKVRTPTFNQLTGPYHEPFCLDIFVSRASVRACIIHRVTSKVVAVAHSISKDMKFDLGSTRNQATCVAVGAVLAQRALADDIHDVIYTPRKGDKLEGKLQIVLQSIMDNGVNVNVKLKQRKPRLMATFPQLHNQ